jgi:S1-C subfamily serine protease
VREGLPQASFEDQLTDRPVRTLADLPMFRRPPSSHTSVMATQLAALSNEIAAAVAQAAPNVVAVHARPRFSSSGVFWRPGVIVTAEHTIRREEEITVTLPDGTNVPATLAGTDPGTDIAVLRIDAATQTPGITTAAPAPGTLVLTIGRSQDSGPNATLGIISASSGEWRTWRGGRLDHYLRLDLTLYPGSDGGAVINTAGETIGIATSALSRIAGLAIPAVTLDRVVEEILARGHVARGYLGVGLQPVELPDHHKGLIVLSLESKGPAAKAGILIGDILVQLGGKPVQDTDDIQLALEGRAVGQTVTIDILRGGESRQIDVTIAERPRSN